MNQHGEQPGTQAVLRAYFKELDAALAALPRARREQLAREIRQHVDQAFTEQPPQSAADLRNMLDRVGLPEDIAAAALEEEPGRPRRPMRPGRAVLIAGATVLVLAGVGTGLAIALTSPKPSRGLAASAASLAARHAVTHSAATTTAPTTPTTTTSRTTTTTPATAPTATVTTTMPATATTTPSSQPSDSTPVTTSPLRAILAPATVPPVSDECTEQLTYDDGSAAPPLCPSGGVNTLAWHWYAAHQPELLTLGPYASPSQVYQAICHDYANPATRPIAILTEEVAQAYYGWKFANKPAAGIRAARVPEALSGGRRHWRKLPDSHASAAA